LRKRGYSGCSLDLPGSQGSALDIPRSCRREQAQLAITRPALHQLCLTPRVVDPFCRALGRRPPHDTPDRQVAEGWGDGSDRSCPDAGSAQTAPSGPAVPHLAGYPADGSDGASRVSLSVFTGISRKRQGPEQDRFFCPREDGTRELGKLIAGITVPRWAAESLRPQTALAARPELHGSVRQSAISAIDRVSRA